VCYSDSTGVNWRTSNYNHSSAYDFDSIGSLTYAAIGGVMVSADYGKTWTATNPLYAGSLVQSIAINGNYLFAGTQDDGVFLSLDGGNSWNPSNTGMSNERVYDILIDGQDMYATGYFGVYLSTDHGNTWQDRSTGIADISVRSLTNIGGKIYAGTYRGVFVTQDKGLTWIPSGLDTIPVNLILNFQGSILAATAQGVYVSGDDGATWDSSSTGLSNRDVRSLVIFNDKIFAGTFGAGVWQTSASSLLGVSGTCRQDLFSVSPNPADQKILIEWGDCRYENVNARLFNCSGVCVWSGQYRGMHSGELDVSNIPGGIYILKLMTGRQSTDLKIVVVHDDK
jgi:photosystem II stability/assembly factor-like uncharacterized protein